MASLTRSRDHSIWFKHIDDPDGDVLPLLITLQPGQSVVLEVGGAQGVWARFNAQNDGKVPPGLKCADDNARRIWNSLSVGASVPLELVCAAAPVMPAQQAASPSGKVESALPTVPRQPEQEALCIGVDVAWWGGQKGGGKSHTRTETIAYAIKKGGAWSSLELKRVDLNPTYNRRADRFTPNADANGEALATAIEGVVKAHLSVASVLLAVDMPILALDRGLARPRKANQRGEKGGVYRQCDEAWMEMRQRSKAPWRRVNIFAGAPIYPRVKELLIRLRAIGFQIFGQAEESASERIVFECFPNEIAWAVGILGYAPNLSIDTLQLYKRLGKRHTPLPGDIFRAVYQYPVSAALRAGGLQASDCHRWLEQIQQWFIEDGVYDPAQNVACTGKKFDDAIDSVLSLSSAVALANGAAHIHQRDPQDGHIIGPGTSTILIE
jgi:hypothetical protein